MEERMKGPVFSQRSRPVPLRLMFVVLVAAAVLGFVFALFPPGSLPPIVGDVFSAEEDNDKATKTGQGTQIVEEPVATQKLPTGTITMTPTPTATLTVTPPPTATPTARILTEAGFRRLVFGEYLSEHGGNMVGLKLLENGWARYDGAEWSEGFLCLDSCYSEETERMVLEAFKQNNSADYWSEWMCQGLYHLFGEWHDGQADFDNARYWFSNPDKEPYFPQFDREYPEDGEFCNAPHPKPTPVSGTSLGWPESVKETVVNTWLYPIVSDGWYTLPNGQYLSSDFKHEDLMALPDPHICWVVANGHYYHGFPSYLPQNDRGHDNYYEIRLRLRDKLNKALGESVNGNPPLCPGFLGMINPPYLP